MGYSVATGHGVLSVEFHTVPLCWCGFPLGFLVSPHLPKHADRQTGYSKFPLGVNENVSVWTGVRSRVCFHLAPRRTGWELANEEPWEKTEQK